MKALIIGYGSIGRRHDEVLSSFSEIATVDIVTKQCLTGKVTFSKLTDVLNINQYDYFLIASETGKHFEQLAWLNEQVSGKAIFCEKPLFEKYYDLPSIQNDVYVGYVLRFHPVLQKVKQMLAGQEILSVTVNCGSYLPHWRENGDYQTSYSARKNEGGGVLLDLSHEIDYTAWLAGYFCAISSYQKKVSNLKIDSDDLVALIAQTDKQAIVNLSIDYFTKSSTRRVQINTNRFTLEADLVKNTLQKTVVNGETENFTFSTLQRNDLFSAMHRELLFSPNKQHICSLKQGIQVMEIIRTIQEQNNE